MGKQHHQAGSVSWAELKEADLANPNRSVRLQSGGAASASLATLPVEETLAWLPGWTEDTSLTVADPISLSLWIRDPFYRVAAPVIRRSMEMEEAAFLLHASEAAWKTHNGRARSWIRKHLEEDLRLRAGGGDPVPDAWAAIKTTKRAALLMDYICIMRSLRVSLWWPDQQAVTVIPLSGANVTAELVQINCVSGRMLVGPSSELKIAAVGWLTLLEQAKKGTDMTWIPPASSPSIGAHTVAQISERIHAIRGSSGPLAGGRAALWNYLMWLLLKESLAGHDVELFVSSPSADSSTT